jgi:hypothetical protein
VEFYIAVHTYHGLEQYLNFFKFNEQYKEPFYTAVSTLYAIVTALALVKGIEDFDALKKSIADEAHKIQCILDMAGYFNNENKKWIFELKKNLAKYAQNVVLLQDKDMRSENYKILTDCRHAIAGLEPEDENDKVALEKMMDEHATLATLRVKRINSVGENIPNYLLIALWVAAVALILPFLSEPLLIADPDVVGHKIDNPERFSQYYMIFLMATLNSFLLLMLADIGDPFDGFWKVDKRPFYDLAAELEEEVMSENSNTTSAELPEQNDPGTPC